MNSPISNRYEFIILFDVVDGNPNGDPDAGNLPRIDPETGHGLVTDVALKRRIRNYVGIREEEKPPFEIYVKEKAVLNLQHARAYKALGLSPDEKGAKKSNNIPPARDWMCANFYDVRTFGAVMTTEVNCGQVRGPVQLTFARSIDPIMTQEHTVTRMAVTTEKEAEKQDGDNRTMGRKFTVPYGLYRAHGFVSAHLAQQTGFSDQDLQLLWEALEKMFEHDRSASRGQVATRALLVFEHEGKLGKAPAHRLFDAVQVKRREGVEAPRSFADYEVSVGTMPEGVKLHALVWEGAEVMA